LSGNDIRVLNLQNYLTVTSLVRHHDSTTRDDSKKALTPLVKTRNHISLQRDDHPATFWWGRYAYLIIRLEDPFELEKLLSNYSDISEGKKKSAPGGVC